MDCIFSVDVEDWFHLLDAPTTPEMHTWEALPSRVEENFHKLLDMFERHDVKVTCFFLGWVAERYPHLVRAASRLGHEVASHGYSHTLVHRMTSQEFFCDIRRAKDILESITGQPVLGYRAPGFSVTRRTPWFFDKVAETGYRYDTSVFPARRAHGGMAGAPSAPYVVTTTSGVELVEFPVSTVGMAPARLYFFGGGYLRLFPWWLIRAAAHRVIGEGRPVSFYVHPREIDPDQPRLRMNPVRMFKSYVNLKTTEGKVENILNEFRISTFRQVFAERWAELETPRKPVVAVAATVGGISRGRVS